MVKFSVATFVALIVAGASAFQSTISPLTTRSTTVLDMSKANNDDLFKPATILAAFLLSNVAFVAPAFGDFGDSSTMLSGRGGGRSGGRAGGRATMSRSRPAPARAAAPAPTRTVERTTIIQAAPSYGYGSPMMMAPSYNPMGGLGLSLGLNAMGGMGNEIRDYNQEREIQDGRRELADARAREQALEQRMQALEQRSRVPAPQ
jgi:hypothetical protein